MKRKPQIIIARWVSILLLLAAAVLAVATGVQASREQVTTFPHGTTIAGVPVGGLDDAQARQRLQEAYGLPVELAYRDAIIQARPDELGFRLDLDAMLAQAHQGLDRPWRDRMWAALWNLPGPGAVDVPLQASVSKDSIRSYLQEQVASRYDNPAQPPMPNGDTTYRPGLPGWALDVDPALEPIETALKSLGERRVELSVQESPAPAVSPESLKAVLEHLIRQDGFDGLVDVAFIDLTSGSELYFALQNGQPVEPDVAFTAASTIKIPIMLSVMRRIGEPAPEEALSLLEHMAVYSENPPADSLMDAYINDVRGPLVVTEDLQALGLKSTFLGGYFYNGAPLLNRYDTPANSRTDINLGPDIYNQTTPGEMNRLVGWIYQCAEQDSGPIRELFGSDVSQSECALILDLLARNRNSLLLEAGVPEGTRLPHKHGWIEEADGLLHTMSDTGVVYTPGGDYAVSIYLYRPQQIDFDATNILVARLSQAIYNAYNLDHQEPWMAYGE